MSNGSADQNSGSQRNLPPLAAVVPNLVDGKPTTDGKAELPIYDPSTGEQIAMLSEADANCVSRAVDSARMAFASGSWSSASVEQRQRVLYDCARAIIERSEELAQLETLCAGIPLEASSRRHIVGAAGWLQYFGERIGSWSGQVHSQTPGATTMVIHEPRGVAAQFAPWNVPVGLALLKVAAAISVGNSVVLKPSEQAPMAVLRAIEILHEAGLPPGVCNVVNGRGSVTGAALANAEGVDCCSFTGGGIAGRAVAQAAAARCKPFVLELGGKSAFVIFDDADIDRALDAALLSIYGNNGQACLAGSRILVQASIYSEFVERFLARVQRIKVGDPFDPTMDMGPLASEKHMKFVHGFVARARAEGDTVLHGGDRRKDLGNGFYIDPIVAECADPQHAIAKEEIFGPFATFMKFSDEAEAMDLANATRFGLVAYLWTRDYQRVLRGYQALRAGTVLVNSAMVREKNAPFGGIGDSGVGSEGGDASLRFYTQEKTVVLAQDWHATRIIGGE